ncbi:hypothetical protein DOY81_006706 [Sarcophaga bullata]|nr:hypothetical protein DOY81_006706 [Sarcophaga bullata]
MTTDRACRAILALECLKKLMDLYQEYEEETPLVKKRKTYIKSEDIETRILKDVTWKHTDTEDAFIPMSMDNFEDIFTKLPNTPTQWLSVANDFENYWHFPHTLGVLDAKQFFVNCTNNALVSNFVMLSIADAHSRFLYTEIMECDEETNESAIYINSNLYKSLKFNTINIPAANRLKRQTMKTEYYFVGTEVFGMDRYVLKEYHQSQNLNQTQKAFNYRLNRVRLSGKMAFDLLFYRFKIFERFDQIDKSTIRLVIKACCMLHNYLTQSLDQPFSHDDDGNNIDASPKICLPLTMQFFEKNEDYSQRSENIGNYCVNEGDIPEQEKLF